jgi:aminoglycoside 3-N-acetyltransferase
MTEEEVVQSTTGKPATVDSIARDLSALGVREGMVLLVHSSLSSLGWVCGGPVAVILALERVLGPDGTLVLPTFSGDLSDPAQWRNPPVPESWWQTIRDTMPPFDPDLTPTRMMGVIPETFRKQKGVIRSDHPELSFCARGPLADMITSNHQLSYGLGENSPLARVYELDGRVLLCGVGHLNNTSIHLAEYRARIPRQRELTLGAPIALEGKRAWTTYTNIEFREDLLEKIGEDFERETDAVIRGRVAQAEARLFPQRALVDFAVAWFEKLAE